MFVIVYPPVLRFDFQTVLQWMLQVVIICSVPFSSQSGVTRFHFGTLLLHRHPRIYATLLLDALHRHPRIYATLLLDALLSHATAHIHSLILAGGGCYAIAS